MKEKLKNAFFFPKKEKEEDATVNVILISDSSHWIRWGIKSSFCHYHAKSEKISLKHF